MKKLYFLLFLFATQLNELISQVPAGDDDQQRDISVSEKQAYQRLRDVTGKASVDTFTVASDNIDVHHYRCEWQIDPSVRFINGKVTVSFTAKSVSDKIIFDLATQLDVDSINYHGTNIGFQRVLKDGLEIGLPAVLNPGQQDSVSIYYKGVPDPLNTGTFFQGNWRGNFTVWTLSEPYGAKYWWPCKNGLSDKADSMDMFISFPVGYTASSNGVLVGDEISGVQQTSHFRHRYPIASYLVAIAISKYNIARDSVLLGGRQMPLLSYSFTWSTPGRFNSAMNVAKLALPKFSDLFGIYPFYKEQYAHTHWGVGGGMEHQTNSFIVDIWPNLVTHELGHQWFGDKVTCGSWQDLWLNEGFATYATNIYYEHFDTALLKPTLQSLINSITSLPDGSVWVNDTTDVNRLFSGRLTYNKGSYVVHMLRWVLGDSVFFKGVRRYLDNAALKYSFARTTDLRKALEEESGKNLETFFQKWIYGEGYPNYHAEWSQNNTNWIKLKLNQTTSHSSVNFYEMPVTIVAKGGSQEKSFVVDHRYSGQVFWLNAGFPVDTFLIDPKLWILSKTKTSSKVSDSAFFKGFRRYLGYALVPYGFARPSDVRGIYGEGYPNYQAEWTQNNNNWIKLKLNQTTSYSSAGFYEMPVTIVAKNGLQEKTFVVDHRYSGQEFWLNAGFAVDTVLFDPKLSILSKALTSSKVNGSATPNELKVYPNPAPSQLKISLKNPTDKKLSIQLLNMLGQIVYEKEVQLPGNDEIIDVPVVGLAKGIYWLRLKSEKGIQYTRKIVH